MRPVHQTILADLTRGDGHDASGNPGNCYQAAIASVLELDLDEVPHFATFADGWTERSSQWFLDRGLLRAFYDPTRLTWPIRVEPGTDFWGHRVSHIVGVIAAGPSPRGPFRHCVVADPRTGRMSHDPHPSSAGLAEVDEVEILLALQEEAQ